MSNFVYDANGMVIHRDSCHFNHGIVCTEYGSQKCRTRCSYNPSNKWCHIKRTNVSPDESLSEDIGYEIGNIRDIHSLTQSRVAEKTIPAVSRNRIMDIETGCGAPITISEFLAICNAIDVPADRLLKRGEYSERKK